VDILQGQSENVLRIDGKHFSYHSLEGWMEKAIFVAYHYHAYTLYIALLLNNLSNALDAVKNCRKTEEGAKGTPEFEAVHVPGILTTAYALYWEAIIQLRQYEHWTQSDIARFEYIVEYFQTCAQNSPSTFRHKSIYLEGLWCFRIL